MASESKKKTSAGNASVAKQIAARVKELKSSKKYDPRREQELNEIYRQYIPPHSMTQTSHLVDVAERDAYVDPFPPIASNKKAGVFIKKGIRAGFGWYAQFLSQQISTFGSGVTRALRSMSNDVEDLKKKVASSKIPLFVYDLNLSNIDKETFGEIAGKIDLSKDLNRVVVSDSIDNAFLNDLSKNAQQLIVVDPRVDAYEKLEANVDARKQEVNEFLEGLEESSVDLILLSGILAFFDLDLKLEIFDKCSRVLSKDGALVFAAVTANTKLTSDQKVADEIFDTRILSSTSYEKVLGQYFNEVETANNVFYCKNSYGDSK